MQMKELDVLKKTYQKQTGNADRQLLRSTKREDAMLKKWVVFHIWYTRKRNDYLLQCI